MQVEFSDIRKSFGSKEVLKGLSFNVESGHAFGLLGRNGAGKTTSIRILMNVFFPDSGDILLNGESIIGRQEEVRSFGYLPEEKGLYPKLQILHQMIYIGNLRGLTKRQARNNARYWLHKLGMLEHQHQKLETLSKGNQQKIQLATALITNPQLVILDEPFSGLDPVNSLLLRDVVQELVDDGRLVFFSSHQMTYVESFCEEVAILDKGEIVLKGKIDEIKRSYPRDLIQIRLSQEAEAMAMPAQAVVERLKELQNRQALSAEISEIKVKDNSALVRLKDPSTRDFLLRDLVNLELPIERFQVVEPSLEDIFVTVTKDSAEEGVEANA
ncbi:MAG: ATP-binding cassette domain-containing protein [Eubacteriales bacterium]|nr:ATP-binding cassette domain-containing protein [Eubacteriales bacterium]